MDTNNHPLLFLVKAMDVILLNTASIGFAWISEAQGIMSLAGICLTVGYTIWKWRRDYRRGKKKDNQSGINNQP